MEIVILGDILHEMTKPIFWKNKTISIFQLTAEFDQRVVRKKG